MNALEKGSKILCAESISTASYIQNWLFSSGCQRVGKNPYEALTGLQTDVGHIRHSGSREFARVPKQSRRGVFCKQERLGWVVGYASGSSYKMYVLETMY